MWERKLVTKRGRVFWLLRKAPFEPPPLVVQFLRMLTGPAAGVSLVLKSDPGPVRLAWALTLVGLMRVIVEELAGLGETGLGAPALLLNIPSVHFLWLATSVLLYGAGRLLGGKGNLRRILQVTGVAFFAYLVIGPLNYLQVIVAVPAAKLHLTPFYSPTFGIGQFVVFGWLALICYQVQRRVHRLEWGVAALSAPLPVAAALVLYLASSGFFCWAAGHLPGSNSLW